MLGKRLAETKRQFANIRNILIGSNRARDGDIPHGLEEFLRVYDHVDLAYWKAYDHCSAVVHCYAAFERFALAAVNEWVTWCLTNQPEMILKNESARTLYETGVAEIIRRKTEARFSGVDHGRLASGMGLFYSKLLPDNISLLVDPFFATQPNLRLKHIGDLFQSVGLGPTDQWLQNSKALQQLCQDEGYNLTNEIVHLVEMRNEAAHGNELPTEILGINDLLALIKLLTSLCISFHDLILTQICRAELGINFEKGYLGQITRLWPKNSACELTTGTLTVSVETKVAFIQEGFFEISKVDAIQLEGLSTRHFYGSEKTALGISIKYLPPVGVKMIDLRNIRGLEGLLNM